MTNSTASAKLELVKKQNVIWSKGFTNREENKSSFFRITPRENKFEIMLTGWDFNKEMYQLIKDEKFGKYTKKSFANNLEKYWGTNAENQEGEIDFSKIKSIDKTYLYFVENIDFVLDKIVEVEDKAMKNTSLEIYL